MKKTRDSQSSNKKLSLSQVDQEYKRIDGECGFKKGTLYSQYNYDITKSPSEYCRHIIGPLATRYYFYLLKLKLYHPNKKPTTTDLRIIRNNHRALVRAAMKLLINMIFAQLNDHIVKPADFELPSRGKSQVNIMRILFKGRTVSGFSDLSSNILAMRITNLLHKYFYPNKELMYLFKNSENAPFPEFFGLIEGAFNPGDMNFSRGLDSFDMLDFFIFEKSGAKRYYNSFVKSDFLGITDVTKDTRGIIQKYVLAKMQSFCENLTGTLDQFAKELAIQPIELRDKKRRIDARGIPPQVLQKRKVVFGTTASLFPRAPIQQSASFAPKPQAQVQKSQLAAQLLNNHLKSLLVFGDEILRWLTTQQNNGLLADTSPETEHAVVSKVP